MTGTIAKSIEERWQARRDSNPQHPVLETGALPVRATGLQWGPKGKNFLVTAISNADSADRCGSYRVSRWTVWARQERQNFLISSRPGVFFLFLVVE